MKYSVILGLLISGAAMLILAADAYWQVNLTMVEKTKISLTKGEDPALKSQPIPSDTVSPQIPDAETQSAEANCQIIRSDGSSRLVKMWYNPPNQTRWEEYEPGQEMPALLKIFNGNVRITYLRGSNRLEIYDWEPIMSKVKPPAQLPDEILLRPELTGTPFASPVALRQAWSSGTLIYHGEEHIAGHTALVLETTDTSGLPFYRLWYDKETLFLLKSEEYQSRADSRRLRTSLECIRVRYGVPLKADMFSMPAVVGAKITYVRVRNATPEILHQLSFTPLIPRHLPESLTVDATSVMTQTVSDMPEENSELFHQSLRSQFGQGSISIFQHKTGVLPLFPEPVGYVKEERILEINRHSAELAILEREGEEVLVLNWAQNGVQITMVGKGLSMDTLLAVAQSMQPME